MEKTDRTRRAKNKVEPPDPYSHTFMSGRKCSSRKSIAAYENHGNSKLRRRFVADEIMRDASRRVVRVKTEIGHDPRDFLWNCALHVLIRC